MTLKVFKDTRTKSGELGALGAESSINFNKNFNASVGADADADADVDTNAWASSIPLTSTSLKQGNYCDCITRYDQNEGQ